MERHVGLVQCFLAPNMSCRLFRRACSAHLAARHRRSCSGTHLAGCRAALVDVHKFIRRYMYRNWWHFLASPPKSHEVIGHGGLEEMQEDVDVVVDVARFRFH